MKSNKDKRITLRLNNDLYSKLKKRATEKEIDISTMVRILIFYSLNEETKIRDVQPILNDLHDLSRSLAGIGGNLNQIAHCFNLTEIIMEPELEIAHKELQVEFRKVIAPLTDLRNKLFDERNLVIRDSR